MASNDPTITEGLSNDQIKALAEPCLTEYLDQILKNVFPKEKKRKKKIAKIIKEEKVPDNLDIIHYQAKEDIRIEIAKIIKKATEEFNGALTSLKPLGKHAYFAVTINMNGTKKRGVTQHRRDLINIILRRCFGVVFCQELPGHFERMISDLTTDNHWDFVRVGKKRRFQIWRSSHGKEAGVIWDTAIFKGTKEGFRPTDQRMRKIRDDIKKEEASNLLSRAAFVKLTTKEDDISFIAVSYHGEKNERTVEARHKIFECLIQFVQELSRQEGNIPFLIGGDFNFDTFSCYDPPENIVVPGYEMTPRASTHKKIPYKDNFYWKGCKAIKVHFTRPFVFGRGEDCDLTRDERFKAENHPDANNHEAKVEDLLDHDPILGILELTDDSEVKRDLANEFQSLSTQDEIPAEKQ